MFECGQKFIYKAGNEAFCWLQNKNDFSNCNTKLEMRSTHPRLWTRWAKIDLDNS